MDKVRLASAVLAGFLLVSAQSAANDSAAQERTEPGEDPAAWKPAVTAASLRFGIPESWIRAVIMAESGGREVIDGSPVTSKAGAMGLMQLMPGTWAEMQPRYGLGADPYDPEANILAGTAYLAELQRRFGFPGLFAAYNAGPERYEEHLETGDPLPDETVFYLKTIDLTGLQASGNASNLARSSVPIVPSGVATSPLFFTSNAPRAGSLFVLLQSQTSSGR